MSFWNKHIKYCSPLRFGDYCLPTMLSHAFPFFVLNLTFTLWTILQNSIPSSMPCGHPSILKWSQLITFICYSVSMSRTLNTVFYHKIFHFFLPSFIIRDWSERGSAGLWRPGFTVESGSCQEPVFGFTGL